MPNTNKITYGIEQVYYAKATDDGAGNLTYASPVPIPGARSISLSSSGENTKWYADNIVYFSGENNNGYEGDLVVAMLPDSFRTDILGEEADTNSVTFEKSDAKNAEFALLFQFEGDANAVRHCFYRCTASRASVTSATVESSITPQTETINLTAMARISDKLVKSRCDETAAPTQYAGWYTAVYEPVE